MIKWELIKVYVRIAHRLRDLRTSSRFGFEKYVNGILAELYFKTRTLETAYEGERLRATLARNSRS